MRKQHIKRIQRFWAMAEKTDSCWIWTSTLTPKGYGLVCVGMKMTYAHRFAFVLANWYLPKKPYEIDHLCRNRACVNPAHLEAVTHKENLNRGLHGAGKPRRRRNLHL